MTAATRERIRQLAATDVRIASRAGTHTKTGYGADVHTTMAVRPSEGLFGIDLRNGHVLGCYTVHEFDTYSIAGGLRQDSGQHNWGPKLAPGVYGKIITDTAHSVCDSGKQGGVYRVAQYDLQQVSARGTRLTRVGLTTLVTERRSRHRPQRCPGDVGRVVGQQEGDRGRDIGCGALAIHRDGLLDRLVDLTGGLPASSKIGSLNPVSIHPGQTQLTLIRSLAKSIAIWRLSCSTPPFGGLVGDAVGLANERCRRPGVDDRASALALHVRDHRAGHEQHALDVHGEVQIPVLEALRRAVKGISAQPVCSTSIRPKRSMQAATMRWTLASSRTSHSSASPSLPSASQQGDSLLRGRAPDVGHRHGSAPSTREPERAYAQIARPARSPDRPDLRTAAGILRERSPRANVTPGAPDGQRLTTSSQPPIRIGEMSPPQIRATTAPNARNGPKGT